MKLRTLLCGAALAAANLLLPVQPAEAVPFAPHPVFLVARPYPAYPAPAAAVLANPAGPHPTYCVYPYPLAPLPLVLAARPC